MSRRFRPAILIIAAQLAAAACAAKVFVPPTGPGAPAPEGATAWTEATSTCRDVKNASGTMRVTFRQGRLRASPISVGVVVTSDGQIRLEDSMLFALAGTADTAQLFLKQENKVVNGRADEIVDAIAGVRLSPQRLLSVLSGCVTAAPESAQPAAAIQYGKRIAVPVSDGRVYLERRDNRWRAMAGNGDGIIVQYLNFGPRWPSEWRATTDNSPFVMDVTVEDLEVNEPSFKPGTFAVQADGAEPMSIDQLRATGPLRRRGD